MRKIRHITVELFTMLASMLFFAGCQTHSPASIPASQTHRFLLANNQVHVPVTISGQGPYWFIIDTGASGFGMIDASLTATVCREVVGQVLVSDGSGKGRRELSEVRCPDVRIGEIRLGDLALIVADTRRTLEHDRERQGILGLEAFRALPFAIDYPAGTVSFGPEARVTGFVNEQWALQLPSFEEGGDEIIAELIFANSAVPIVVDTGSSSGFNLPCDSIRELPTTAPWKEAGHANSFGNRYPIYDAHLIQSLNFFGHAIEQPAVRCNNHHQIGIVGYQVLQFYRLSVDLPSRLVRID